MEIINQCLTDVRAYMASHGGKRSTSVDQWVVARTRQMLMGVLEIDSDERRSVLSQSTGNELGYLQGIARSMAEVALDMKQAECLRLGLMALIAEDRCLDFRETLQMLSMLDNSSKILEVSLSDYYAELEPYSSSSFRDMITKYWEAGGSTIGQMGYRLTQNNSGQFRYEQLR